MGHKVADAVYSRITGEGGYFDSRVIFVSESGPKDARAKRLAIMDYDGAGVQYLTSRGCCSRRASRPGRPGALHLLPVRRARDLPPRRGSVRQQQVPTAAGEMAFSPASRPTGGG
jgi:TolB protein